MVNRPQPITLMGSAALLIVALLLLGPLLALLWRAETTSDIARSDWTAIRFTIFQATLSALISVGLAIPVARALARRQFRGRSALITLLGAPFLLPSIVAVLGLLAVWGRAGVISKFLMFNGFERIDIYGLSGILLAHVFFNLPLATRMILQGWSSIPSEHFRLAAQLGCRPSDTIRHLEIPMLRGVLPTAFLLVFLLCLTSFAVALALGGGPKATTIELAIYQALRYDFDLNKAALLGLIQFALCASFAMISLRFSVQVQFDGGLDRAITRWDNTPKWLRWQDILVLGLTVLFVSTPLITIILRGLPSMTNIPISVWPAVKNSLIIALCSAALALTLAVTLALFIDKLKARRSKLATLSEILGLITLSASPFVLGTGLFIIINPFFSPFALALPITALVNATISLPLALRSIMPTLEQNRRIYGPLAESLDMRGLSHFRYLIWPAIRKPAGFATGLAAALSMGDLGVITLFAPPNVETLPLVMYRLMGTYRLDQAASVALILVVLTLTLFWIFDRGGRLGRHS